MSAAEDRDNDLVGRVVLGRYRIVRPLARGGMGMIYLARSEGAADFVKPVVVKRMLSDQADASAVKMFKREARIMSMLRHPGIVSVTDFGREDGSYLLVMDYVHGFHLGRWASFVQQARQEDGQPGQLPWQMAVHLCIQVLDALEYAHTLKASDGSPLHIVHRDVSPSNVLLDIEGRVLLADFGIAKTAAMTEEETKTTVGTVKGKFSYMAPEILEGAPPEPSADVYATAVVLHEVLVGRNEFRTQEPAATIQRVLHHTPRRLDVVRPDIPSPVADVVARALLKRPEERFSTAAELAKALRRVRGLDAEESNAELRRLLERDFRDPRFAQMFDLPELDTLEHSWRTVPDGLVDPASFPPAPTPVSRQSNPTRLERPEPASHVAAGHEPLPRPPPLPAESTPRTNNAAVLVSGLLALVLLAIVAAGGVWYLQGPPATTEVVFVEATPSGIVATDAAVVLPDAYLELPDATTGRGPPSTRDPRHSDPSVRTPGQIIDREFARNTAAIRNCFEGSAPPAGQVWLRFTTGAEGEVTDLEITPADVGSGSIGRCIQGVARRIDFTSDVGARSFRIPITVRTE
ncbi:MAG: protein kinase [Sandaracinaceae bacterium]|nr:protein kinase [Sandaracinaceae bacterium]